MSRHDKHHRLPRFAVFVTLVAASAGLLAQQAPATAEGAAQQPSQPQSAQPQTAQPQTAQPLTPAPQAQVTPEQLGDSMLAHKRYQAAIAAYKMAPANSAAVWNKMGIAHQMMLNQDEAVRCYRRSLKLNPKDPNVLNNLGTIYDSIKDYKAAEKMYRKALKVEPKSPLILKNLGTSLITQHKYKKGWEAYKEALALDPELFARSTHLRVENAASAEQRGAMNYYLAKGCLRAGMTEQAIDYLRKALNEGYTTPRKIVTDTEFSALHGVPAFEQLLAAQKSP